MKFSLLLFFYEKTLKLYLHPGKGMHGLFYARKYLRAPQAIIKKSKV